MNGKQQSCIPQKAAYFIQCVLIQHSKTRLASLCTAFTSRRHPNADHPESMDRIGVQWPHQSRRPPTKASVEIEDATAQNCLVLLTLCKAASIYAATGSHRQWRLNSCGLIFCIEISHIGWEAQEGKGRQRKSGKGKGTAHINNSCRRLVGWLAVYGGCGELQGLH